MPDAPDIAPGHIGLSVTDLARSREGGNSAALFFADPDGIRLEVYSPAGAAGLAAPVPGAPSCGFF